MSSMGKQRRCTGSGRSRQSRSHQNRNRQSREHSPSNGSPFQLMANNEITIFQHYEEEIKKGRAPIIKFSMDGELQSSFAVTYAPRSICRALEGFNVSDIITVNFESIRLSPKDMQVYIMKRIENGLEIKIKNKCKIFHFYGCSSSQLKSRKAIMVHLPPDDIENHVTSLGDFSNIGSASKLTKRIGLFFSTFEPIALLEPSRLQEIDDVFSHSGELLTDGCGFVSRRFAHCIATIGNIVYRGQRYLPSVYQFRYLGCKGVLALQPNMPPSIDLQTRPSMQKIKKTKHNMFGLVEASKPYSFGALNAEHATLLVEMGVDPDVLLQKQRGHFEFLQNAMTNTEEAFELLVYRGDFSLAEEVLRKGVDADVFSQVRKHVNRESTKEGIQRFVYSLLNQDCFLE